MKQKNKKPNKHDEMVYKAFKNIHRKVSALQVALYLGINQKTAKQAMLRLVKARRLKVEKEGTKLYFSRNNT